MIEHIDRYFIDLLFGSQSAVLDHFALVITDAWTWLPLYIALFVLIIKNHDNMQQIAICFGCAVLGVLIATGLTSVITKPLFERVRPCNDPEFKYLADIAGNFHSNDYSFFSSHAATTMSLVVFFACLTKSKLLTFFMTCWSLSLCWSRLYLGQHFFTDVFVGFIWGICSGSIAFIIYRRFCLRLYNVKYAISDKYTSTGIDKFDIEMIVLILLLTYIYAIVTPLNY